jgi:hypothetical protein
MIGTSPERPHPPELALYYPGHLWRSHTWIKTLLLFFDGISLLVPEYKIDQIEEIDPSLAIPLREAGLLKYLVADKIIDKEIAVRMAAAVEHLITSGIAEPLMGEETAFHEISMSRMGFQADGEVARELFRSLKDKGLARDSQDGLSIPLHPLIRYFILTFLAQGLRAKGPGLGLDLSPATDQTRVMNALSELLAFPSLPSAGNIVAFDLQAVAVDLAKFPLNEVLDFRAEHLEEHRDYRRRVRRFARELAQMPEAERPEAFEDRQTELDDLASDLKKRGRSAWKKPASFLLSLAGSFWTLNTGDPIGAFLAGGAALAGGATEPTYVGAYSYLFAARQEFD